jgi:hypothetical protein
MPKMTLSPLEAVILGETRTAAAQTQELEELLLPEYSKRQFSEALRRLQVHNLIRSWGYSRGRDRMFWMCTALGITLHESYCAHLDQMRLWPNAE